MLLMTLDVMDPGLTFVLVENGLSVRSARGVARRLVLPELMISPSRLTF